MVTFIVLYFIGRHELALRGDRDYGPFNPEELAKDSGIFRGFLGLLATSGDEGAKLLADASSVRAQLISPRIQNELLSLMAEDILKEEIEKINQSPFFCIMADETSNYNKERISVVIRYYDVEEKRTKVCKSLSFLGFNKFLGIFSWVHIY